MLITAEELDHDVVIEEEEERGRSRVAKTPHLAASDVISFNETATEAGGSASITFSMSVEGSIGDATEDTSIKLDPSAVSIRPSSLMFSFSLCSAQLTTAGTV